MHSNCRLIVRTSATYPRIHLLAEVMEDQLLCSHLLFPTSLPYSIVKQKTKNEKQNKTLITSIDMLTVQGTFYFISDTRLVYC